MSIFRKIKDAFIEASVLNGKVRARNELLRMSDRQLTDFGFSKELLQAGVSAWPWRMEEETVNMPLQVDAARITISQNDVMKNGAAQRVDGTDRKAIQKAITELNAYSDRDLAELGIARNSIEEMVRHGRPMVEGVFESHKHAA